MKKNVLKKVSVLFISIFIACIVFFSIVYYKESNNYNFKGQSIKGEVSLKDFKGKNVVVYFGYTYCPDVCPLTLENLLKSIESLEEKNISVDDFVLLYITLDPLRDNVEMLDEYASWFYPNSVGIRFEEKDLMEVAKNYNIKYQIFPMDDKDYSVAHSSALFFFNKKGKFVEKVTNLTVENISKAAVKTVDKQ